MKITRPRNGAHVDSGSEPSTQPQEHTTTRRALRCNDQHPARPRSRQYTVLRRSRQKSGVNRSAQKATILAVVGALVAAFTLPAYASPPVDAADSLTLQQVAADDSQSLVVASEVSPPPPQRGTFSATTPDEIAKKKAAEAAARATANAQVASSRFDFSMVSPGSGLVRWPLSGPFTVGDRFGARGGAHMGTDMLAEGGTPIFAALDGVVRISQDSYSAYGVAIVLESVVNGRRVSTVYPHMRTGSRQVGVGQTVSAGQLIGLVGSTGRSTANHLHFEVYIDGQAVDSLSWLEANAG